MLRNLCLFMVVGLQLAVEVAQAQRPSFAGIRPPGGLNQKDKYLGTQNTAVENLSGVSVATRFGEEAVVQQVPVNLPYGASQKPPVGVPLVLPVSSFVPNPTPVAAASTPSASVDVASRFGGSDSSATVPLSSSAGFAPAASTPVASALPIDARGDQDYVNHLNSLPEDQRPFWFINYQAIEALRNSSRPNVNAVESRGSFFAG
ncbi:hypothetical protein KR093_007497 [Drosophila rubida]|uniref:Uncharacterized protein n=1 Tax=Drosophila rubida TaxID=30044 RepID=A0AAD4PLP9_9MUSC|nr:hypothetical protein KR093_007497 [Drosophila rubida]